MNLRFVLILFFPLFNYAQNSKEIHGVLFTEKLPINGCFVQVIGDTSANTIAFDITNSKGEYSITINDEYRKIRIKITHLEFLPTDTLVMLEKKSTFLSFNLIKKQYLLPSVQITGKRNIQIDGDTTNYIVQGLKKNEKTIEELIKKLPGFEVNSDGEIKYKNKRISTILIDGDNLIQNDYKVLSKNLTPEMVDKIQAIENYTSNELLKGIEKGNETVLNLTINKNFKGIVFNKADLLSTLKDTLHELNILTLNIFPQVKMINVFNKNNINKNSKNINFSINTLKESTKPLLDNSYITKLNQDDIFRFNNQIYNTLNIFKKKKNKFESNIKYDYLSDNQINYNFTSTSYLNVLPIFNVQESQNINTHIESHNVISGLKIFSSSSTFFKINLENSHIKSNLNKQLFNSFNNQINSIFDTTNVFNANLYLIKKLNSKKVLEIETFCKRKIERQRLSIIPEIKTIFLDSIYEKIVQQDFNKWNLSQFEARLKGKCNFINYVFALGISKMANNINSNIDLTKALTHTSNDSLHNNALIKTNEFYVFNKIDKKINNRMNLTLEQNLNKSFIDYRPIYSNKLFYNPYLLLKYKIDGFQNIDFSFKKKSTFIEENYYLQNYYFNKYNSLVKNNFSEIIIEKTWEITSNYSSINIFKNQRFILFNLNYSITENPILQQSSNNLYFILQKNQAYNSPLKTKNFTGYLFCSKIISPIKSTVGFSVIYLNNQAKIAGRDNSLNDLKFGSSSLNLSVNSKFKESFNFEFKFGVNYYINSISEKSSVLLSKSFSNIGYNSSIKLMSNFKKYLSTNCKFSLIKNNITTSLLDFDIAYNFEKSNFLLSVGGQNLLNNSSLTVYNQNENFIQKNSSIIFPRFLYMKFLYKFSFKL